MLKSTMESASWVVLVCLATAVGASTLPGCMRSQSVAQNLEGQCWEVGWPGHPGALFLVDDTEPGHVLLE